ncbi:uncharacterized protein G2W53_021970 [Senna tora]|uniref:Uncharacterized protein n=1 Tax=Senna tora TaxID=362788 RepID=A0A834TMV4_9FABA|nr:uncharacterized protein G2W53_021970 [Senna tora]
MVGSKKPSRITRQKTCCACEGNMSVHVVIANRSGFDAPIGVVMAWEEYGSCLNIFRTRNRSRISETFTTYEAKDLLRKSQKPSRITRQKTSCACEGNTSVRVVFVNRSGFDVPIGLSGFDAPTGVVKAWEVYGTCFNIFRMRNRNDKWQSDLRNLHEFRGKRLLAQSGFNAPVGVVMAWEERGSCLNIFQTINGSRISETFTNFEAKDFLHSGFDVPIGVVMAWEKRGSCLNIFRTTNHVFANRCGFDGPIGVVKAWEERGSCLNILRAINRGRISETFTNYEAWDERGSCPNIFRTTNHSRISENFTNYEAKDLLRKKLHELQGKRLVAQGSETRRFELYLRTGVDLMLEFDSSRHGRSLDYVLTYYGRQIVVESQKPS